MELPKSFLVLRNEGRVVSTGIYKSREKGFNLFVGKMNFSDSFISQHAFLPCGHWIAVSVGLRSEVSSNSCNNN